MSDRTALLLSIRPNFAEQIFSGTKTIELRRVRPRVAAGDLIIVYASGKTKALMGAFQVGELVEATPELIWTRFGTDTGLGKADFGKYFAGVTTAFGITVAQTWSLPAPIPLTVLRRLRENFRPPQGYHYLRPEEVLGIGGGDLVAAHRKPLPSNSNAAQRAKQKDSATSP